MRDRVVQLLLQAKDTTAGVFKSIQDRARATSKAMGDGFKSAFGAAGGLLGAEAIKKLFDTMVQASPAAQAQIEKLGTGFKDLLGRFGDAVFGSKDVQAVLAQLADGMASLGGWISRNADTIGRWIANVGKVLAMAAEGYRLIGGLLVDAFRALHVRVIEGAAAFESLGHRWNLAIGGMLVGLGELVKRGGALLKVFGITAGVELGDRLATAGGVMQRVALINLRRIEGQAKATIKAMRAAWDEADARPARIPPRQRGGGDGTAGPRAPTADERAIAASKDRLRPQGGYRDVKGELAMQETVAVAVDVAPVPAERIRGVMQGVLEEADAFAREAGPQALQGISDVLTTAVAQGGDAAKDVAVQAIGQILNRKAELMIKEGVVMSGLRIALKNPFTSGPALIAAGLTLRALSSALTKVTSGGTGGGGSRVGTSGGGAGGTFSDTNLTGAGRSQTTVVIEGGIVNFYDPNVRRQFGTLFESLVANGDVRIVAR